MSAERITQEKYLAAEHALKYVKDGMIVGLGSGSTASIMIQILGKMVAEGLTICAVASSYTSEKLAQSLGIITDSLEAVGRLDINIDGADEFDPQLRLIKGGGGAFLKEKILAHNSDFNLVITDSGKQVKRLGNFKLPIETIPYATSVIAKELEVIGLRPKLRPLGGSNFVTEEGNYILDLNITGFKSLKLLNSDLLHIPGVVETGLFLNTTDLLIMGLENKIVAFDKKEVKATSSKNYDH